MNYPKELLDRYYAFYRAQKKQGRPTSTDAVKPLKNAIEILIRQTHLSPEEMKDTISAALFKLMQQVHMGTARGRWVLSGEEERSTIQEFSRFLVDDFFLGAMNGDRARIAGNTMTLILHTCEFLYLNKQDNEEL
jgi:CRISPR type I-D-associated protein Csc3/Cas10d